MAKKAWCCQSRGRGCPPAAGGCGTAAPPFDCDAGFANWQAGWSLDKKAFFLRVGHRGPYSDVCAERKLVECLLVEVDWRMAKLVNKGVLTVMLDRSTSYLNAS